MNPIENLRAFLKIKVSMRKPSNLKELTKAIKTEWIVLPSELVKNLISSMESRVKSVLELNGDYTTYESESCSSYSVYVHIDKKNKKYEMCVVYVFVLKELFVIHIHNVVGILNIDSYSDSGRLN